MAEKGRKPSKQPTNQLNIFNFNVKYILVLAFSINVAALQSGHTALSG